MIATTVLIVHMPENKMPLIEGRVFVTAVVGLNEPSNAHV